MIQSNKEFVNNLSLLHGRFQHAFLPVFPIWEPAPQFIPPKRDTVAPNHKEEVAELLKSPLGLTYLSALPLSNLNDYFPYASMGYYLPETIRPPSAETERYMKFFGANGPAELIRRTKNTVKALFPDNPYAVYNITTAMDFMEALHGEEKRRTGEPAVCHDIRTLLRSLIEFVSYHDICSTTPTIYPGGYRLDPFMELNQSAFAARLAAITLHDAIEDHVKKGHASIGHYPYSPPSVMELLKQGGKPLFLIFPDQETAGTVRYMLDAFTGEEFHPGILTIEEEAISHLLRIWTYLDDQSSDKTWFTSWAIAVGKASDREDNAAMLWKHSHNMLEDRYLDKLEETLLYVQALSLVAWRRKHATELYSNKGQLYTDPYELRSTANRIQDVPLAATTATLKLLGASDEEIFGWVTTGKCRQTMNQLELEGKEPLLIPSPTQADILTNTGKHLVIHRNGNS